MQASTLTKSQAGLSNCQFLQWNSYYRRSSGDVKWEREINLAYAALLSAPARMTVIMYDC